MDIDASARVNTLQMSVDDHRSVSVSARDSKHSMESYLIPHLLKTRVHPVDDILVGAEHLGTTKVLSLLSSVALAAHPVLVRSVLAGPHQGKITQSDLYEQWHHGQASTVVSSVINAIHTPKTGPSGKITEPSGRHRSSSSRRDQ